VGLKLLPIWKAQFKEAATHTFRQDVQFAFRQLLQNPGFATASILSLALGIGATVSVFSIIYAVLLNPWPYAGADRICQAVLLDKAGDESGFGLTGPQIRQLRHAHALEDVFAVDGWSLTVTGSDVPEDVQGIYLTGNGFRFLGVPAMLGRYFEPSDAPDGKEPEPVVVLSYKFWQRHFNGDPSVVGKSIQLIHKPYIILGVLPPRFTWMDADLYVPLNPSTSQNAGYGAIFKLKPGVTQAAAAAELQPLFQEFAKQTPKHFPKQYKFAVRDISYRYFHQLGPTLYLLLGGVMLLLAIGCGNVSILLLARGTARQHEFAVRSAVGASGFQIVRQLLTESLLLAVTGAGLGVILAYRSLGFIVARLPEYSFPHEADFHVNVPVLLFSVGLAIVTGVLFGLFPALQMVRPDLNQIIRSSARNLAGTVRGKRFHTALIAGQIALTLLLTSGAGTAIEGFVHLMHVPLGYDPHRVMSVGIPVHDNTFTTWEARARYFERLRDEVAKTPGVVATGISTNATPPDNGWNLSFDLLGKNASEQQDARVNFVDSAYFTVLKIPLAQGRLWNPAELTRGATLALVNRTFARRYLRNGEILGHSIRVSRLANEPPYTLTAPGADGWLQIIGVVGDALDDGLDKPVKPAIFVPYTLSMHMWTQILVRAHSEPLALLHTVRQQISKVNPDQQAFARVYNLDTWIVREPEWARGQLVSILFGVFSVLALVLAAAGLYSVVSYSVLQRTNEIGVRMALGAHRVDILWLVFASAGLSVGLGLALGMALSFGSTRLFAQWATNSGRDPLLVMGACLLLVIIAALACVVPARRASGVDPMAALRCE
jgi:predicted permease